ncbi:MAG: hypothetical protein JO337_05325 [Acidimicrobiales bacterium]|nr:hypothetical protein [Acidimicrobiales bacterium]
MGLAGRSTSSILPGFEDEEFEAVSRIVHRAWDLGNNRLGVPLLVASALRHRGRLAKLAASLDQLPTVAVELSAGDEGQEIRRLLLGPRGKHSRHSPTPSRRSRLASGILLVPDRRAAVALAELPDDIDLYLRGGKRQAVRTNLARAKERGIVSSEVTGRHRQWASLEEVLASRDDDWLVDNRDWCERGLSDGWLRVFVATGPDRAPLNVALLVADKHWAVLRLCVGIDSDLSGYARYSIHFSIIEELIGAGAGFLLVNSVFEISPGLRYFQRRLGFELVNVALTAS